MERFASCSFGKDFHSVQVLFRSPAGVVYRAVFKYDNKTYVLKERKLAELGKRKDIMNEVKLLQQLRHSNVVQCEGWFRDLERDCLFIVLEYCDGGDLNKLIDEYRRDGKRLKESEIWNIFYQICLGLCHLHENGIIHRDIKALNVMTNKDRTIFKIGDLGVSRQLSEYTEMLNTFYGTPLYLSPELIENKAYNEKTDIWSLGVVLYEMCMLAPPFHADTLLGLAKQVLKGEYPPISSRYSKNMSRCIRWLLTKDFRKRPHIAQVIDFIREKVGIANTMAVAAPSTRQSDDSMDEDSLGSPRRDRSGRPSTAKTSQQPSHASSAGAHSETESEGEDIVAPPSVLVQQPALAPNTAPKQTLPLAVAAPLTHTPRESVPPAEKPKERVVRIGGVVESSAALPPQSAPVMVEIDLARAQAKLRREHILHRRLLQTKNFVSASDQQPQPPSSSSASSSPRPRSRSPSPTRQNQQHHQQAAIEASLQQCRANILALESALTTGKMNAVDAARLDLKAVLAVAPATEVAAPTEATRDTPLDDLPVYLQPAPQRYRGLSQGGDKPRPATAGSSGASRHRNTSPNAANNAKPAINKVAELQAALEAGFPAFLEKLSPPREHHHRHHVRERDSSPDEAHNLFNKPMPRPRTASQSTAANNGPSRPVAAAAPVMPAKEQEEKPKEGVGLVLPSMQPQGVNLAARMMHDQRLEGRRRPATAAPVPAPTENRSIAVPASEPLPASPPRHEPADEIPVWPVPLAPPAQPARPRKPGREEDDWLFNDRHRIYKHGRPKTDITSRPGPAPLPVGRDVRTGKGVRERQSAGFNIITNL